MLGTLASLRPGQARDDWREFVHVAIRHVEVGEPEVLAQSQYPLTDVLDRTEQGVRVVDDVVRTRAELDGDPLRAHAVVGADRDEVRADLELHVGEPRLGPLPDPLHLVRHRLARRRGDGIRPDPAWSV